MNSRRRIIPGTPVEYTGSGFFFGFFWSFHFFSSFPPVCFAIEKVRDIGLEIGKQKAAHC